MNWLLTRCYPLSMRDLPRWRHTVESPDTILAYKFNEKNNLLEPLSLSEIANAN